MTNPIVVDLSHWNPTPNWGQLKAGGTVGVIHKATEGTSYVDNTLFARAKAAMAEGLCWSTYHFMRPGSIEAQMDWYLGTIKPKLGERVVLDHEDAGVSFSDLKKAVLRILQTRPDLQVTIYSGHLIKEQLGNAKDQFLADSTSLWIAQYTTASAPTWPSATWPSWSLWQYTDKATANGVSAPVDGNKWNGTQEALIQWFGPAENVPPQPEPEPVPEPPPVVALTVPPGVIIEINGQEVWR